MCDEILDEFNVAYTRHQIQRCLIQQRGFSVKAVEIHAKEQDPIIRSQFRHLMRPQRLGGAFSAEHCVFMDETHCNSKDAERRFGTSLVGEDIEIRSPFNRGGYSNSGISAMGVEGMLSALVYDQTVDADTVIHFLQHELLPLMNPYPQPRSVLILDNAKPHCKVQIELLCQHKGVIVLWLPTYSYDFNPIENAFSEVKALLRRRFGLTEAQANFPHPARLLFCLLNSAVGCGRVLILSKNSIFFVKYSVFLKILSTSVPDGAARRRFKSNISLESVSHNCFRGEGNKTKINMWGAPYSVPLDGSPFTF